MAPKLVVFGGSGLLGRQICIGGARRGMDVLSVGSRGNKWTDDAQIECVKGDVFDPQSYRRLMVDADVVVSSIGILLEGNYKPIVNSKSVCELVSNLTQAGPEGNPMARHLTNKGSKATYERLNRDSALILAQTLAEMQPERRPVFGFVSADRAFPGVPSRYIETKRQAEDALLHMKDRLRPIVLRPGIMYDTEGSGVRDCIKTIAGGPIFNHFFPVVSTSAVADSLFDAVQDPAFEGVVGMDKMRL